MGEALLSLRLDTENMDRLETEARLHDVVAGNLARRVIEHHLELQESERDRLKQRVAEADKGVFVSKEAVTRWVES